MDDDEWPDQDMDDNEGWDYGEDVDDNIEEDQIPTGMKKVASIINSEVKSFTLNDLMAKQIPAQVEEANETLFLDTDSVISVLRHFDWNKSKMEESWFDNTEKLKIQIGLTYDVSLNKKYPEIVERLAENNQNMCNVMYMEFDDNDDDMRADSCICGHQFSALCWVNYLKDKVKSSGAICMFSKCPQLRCNVVVPHSKFLKYLKDEVADDGINYYQRYLKWHCKQFTEFNHNIKWCPKAGCENVVYKSDYATQNGVKCLCGHNFCF